jgi:hypothetical protein
MLILIKYWYQRMDLGTGCDGMYDLVGSAEKPQLP